MSIEIHEHGTFVEFRVFGATTIEEIVEVSWLYHRDTPQRLCVWDFREANVSALRAENLGAMSQKGAEIAAFRGDGARNAILLRNTADTMHASAFGGMTNVISRAENEMFLDRGEALGWLTDGKAGPAA